MTQEEKAKAYDEALERAQCWLNSPQTIEDCGYTVEDAIQNIFPVLKESEDERIRKTLIEELSACNTVGELKFRLPAPTREECIAWLEKQKEQKPSMFTPGLGEVHWNPISSEKDVHKWNLPEDFEEAVYKVANFISPFDSQEELRKVSHRFAEQLLSLAKKEFDKFAEWSEEDEEMLDIVLTMVDCSTVVPHSGGQLHPSESYKKDISEWLKSLRPSWKPSEEQMKALRKAVNKLADTEVADSVRLSIMYDHLKELI